MNASNHNFSIFFKIYESLLRIFTKALDIILLKPEQTICVYLLFINTALNDLQYKLLCLLLLFLFLFPDKKMSNILRGKFYFVFVCPGHYYTFSSLGVTKPYWFYRGISSLWYLWYFFIATQNGSVENIYIFLYQNWS